MAIDLKEKKQIQTCDLTVSFVKNVGLAIGESVLRGANKSFQKKQRQFCGKRKMLFILSVSANLFFKK